MKQIILGLILLMLMGAACTPVATSTPVDSVVVPATEEPAATSAPTEPPAVNPKLPAASFEVPDLYK